MPVSSFPEKYHGVCGSMLTIFLGPVNFSFWVGRI